MSRQPLLPKFKTAKLIYGPGQIKSKPEIATAVGRCIMIFSYVDWQMAVLLAALLKAESDGSIAVFLTLKNARAQREVLTAASEDLDKEHRELFEALMLVYGSLQSKRADLAHGVFGVSPDIPDDSILWVEAKNLSKHWVDKFHRPKTLADLGTDLPYDDADLKRNTFTYDLPSLVRLESEISNLWTNAFFLTLALRYPATARDTKELVALKASPQMQQALSQIRSQKKTE